jgi:hypothetical protein
MAYKCREEIVGKRFLSVSGFTKLKSGKISEWGWRAGVIRAATHKDNNHPELQVRNSHDISECQKGGVYPGILTTPAGSFESVYIGR